MADNKEPDEADLMNITNDAPVKGKKPTLRSGIRRRGAKKKAARGRPDAPWKKARAKGKSQLGNDANKFSVAVTKDQDGGRKRESKMRTGLGGLSGGKEEEGLILEPKKVFGEEKCHLKKLQDALMTSLKILLSHRVNNSPLHHFSFHPYNHKSPK